jgi:hypothetical protein
MQLQQQLLLVLGVLLLLGTCHLQAPVAAAGGGGYRFGCHTCWAVACACTLTPTLNPRQQHRPNTQLGPPGTCHTHEG